MQQPYMNGYYYPPPPPPLSPPVKPESIQLRRDAGFVGVVVLVVAASLRYLSTLFVYALLLMGVLDMRDLTLDDLGLGNTGYLVFYAILYACSMGIPPVLAALISRRRYFPLSPAKSCSVTVAVCGTLAALGGCMLSSLLTSYLMYYLSQFGIPIPESPEMMVHEPLSLALGLIVMAVLPALLEEMVFRGYVLRTLRPYGDFYAVMVSAVMFGLIHGNIRQVPFALVSGILLGWLYVATNNIWLPVVVHFCNNAVSVLLEYFGFSLTDGQLGVMNLLTIAMLIGLGVLALLVLVVRHGEVFHLRRNATGLTGKERTLGLLKSPLFVICLVFLLYLMWVVQMA